MAYKEITNNKSKSMETEIINFEGGVGKTATTIKKIKKSKRAENARRALEMACKTVIETPNLSVDDVLLIAKKNFREMQN